MLSLSPEIIEWIIDFVWDDNSALSACALVGTGWRPRAHGHLFSQVLIHTLPRSAALISLLDDRPDLAPRIRTLQAWLGHGARQVPWFYSSSSAGFLSLLRRLPRLGALELLNFDWVEFEDLNGPEALHGTLFLELLRLRCTSCVLPGDVCFSNFLCTLPRLRALELVSSTWSNSVQAETSPLLATASALQLQNLAISACWGEPSHRPWATAISAGSLSSLEMTVHGSADVEKWQILVDAACDTLRQIKVIEPEASRSILQLDRLRNLHRLAVTSGQVYNARAPHRNPDPLAAFIRLLHTTRSPFLAEASIAFENPSDKLFERVSWSALRDAVREVPWRVGHPRVAVLLRGDWERREESERCAKIADLAADDLRVNWLVVERSVRQQLPGQGRS